MKNKNNILFETILSKSALDWVYQYGQPVASHEFVGWIFPATKDMNGVIDLNGKWGFYSCAVDKNGKFKPLKEKKLIKYLMKLLKQGFLVVQEQSPFPEFEYYSNIAFDISRVHYFDGELFDYQLE